MTPLTVCHALFFYLMILHHQCPTSGEKATAAEYDFIIVGGGSAGSVVTGRLSEDRLTSVLLLEAGGPPPADTYIPGDSFLYSSIDWQFATTPQENACNSFPNNECIYDRGKVLGGSSTINGMMYIRGNHKDYDNFAAMGNEGWSWNEVLPYFRKAEGNTIKWLENDHFYHNSNGPLAVSDARYQSQASEVFLDSTVEQGYKIIDVNGASQNGFTRTPFTMDDGSRCNAYKAYVEPVLYRKNLEVLANSQVLKILFDVNKKAVGVTYSNDGVVYNVTAKKEVILSAGVIQSPQILMLSGIGPADQLKQFNIPIVADLPGVGNNFGDHVVNMGMLFSCNNLGTIPAAFKASNASLNEWLYYRAGPLTVPIGGFESTGFISTSSDTSSTNWPDAQLIFSATPLEPEPDCTFVVYPFLLHTKSIGTIRLQSADPFAKPLVDPNLLSDEDDVNRLLKASQMVLKLTSSHVYKDYNVSLIRQEAADCDTLAFPSDEYLKCILRYYSFCGLHGVGTCKMGPDSDPTAVVDPVGLRVKKVSGLRVIDASIMPQVVSGNTNAPTIMVGEKGSSAIKKQYGLADAQWHNVN